MLSRFVLLDLFRNPRRSLSTLVGVTLGVGLFCGVLFFIDGLSASMTQQAVAPLEIDMQRILSQRVGDNVLLSQTLTPIGAAGAAQQVLVRLAVRNNGEFSANEVTVRSRIGSGLQYVPGTAAVGGNPIVGFADNPFAHGPGRAGYNLGEIKPGGELILTYKAGVIAEADLSQAVRSWYSSRESVRQIPANQPLSVALGDLARRIGQIEGVKHAHPLSFADLEPNALSSRGVAAPGVARIFGLDRSYADRNGNISITEGGFDDRGAVISVEGAALLKAGIGDRVSVRFPDQSSLDVQITGLADLTRARSLFSSRRGADLEAFIYRPVSIIVSPQLFADRVFPAYQRAGTGRGAMLKNPLMREIDITLDHNRLDGSPEPALAATQRIGAEVMAIAAHQDFLLDNISNTLQVAVADARTAKNLFFFLGVPGGLLAAMLAVYAASVLATVQRREQATLRVRGAAREHLVYMLALRTTIITGVGAVVGFALGLGTDAFILGFESLQRAGLLKLATSTLLGTLAGFLATGASLYVTGRISIEKQINEDRAQYHEHAPFWMRARLDLLGMLFLAVCTAAALYANAFEGEPGSVYFGRGVKLNPVLLVLPILCWLAGSFLAVRILIAALSRAGGPDTGMVLRPWPGLFQLSVARRPWPIGHGAAIVSLVVALAVSFGAFTASYNRAKAQDARYATGSDIRITPGPAVQHPPTASDSDRFRVAGIGAVTPVIYGFQNAILRSARTSDPASLLAMDPETFGAIAPLHDSDFIGIDAAEALRILKSDPAAILVDVEFASFLQASVGDRLHVLLVRGTKQQRETTLRIAGLFKRLPGSPDGVQALMSIHQHRALVPDKHPDFFLAATVDDDPATLQLALDALRDGPGKTLDLHIESRASLLARDQSSLAALNVAGLVELDWLFSLGMATVAIGIFVFGLLLHRRREYITLRAQGLEPSTIRLLITAEATVAAVGGAVAGALVGWGMGLYLVRILQPLFVHMPAYIVPAEALGVPIVLVCLGGLVSAVVGSRHVNGLHPTELLRDE